MNDIITQQPIQIIADSAGIINAVPFVVAPPIKVNVTPEALTIFTAAAFRWPIQHITPLQIVGRFAKIDYIPVAGKDPDIILAIDWTDAANDFNRVMLEFQEHRREYRLNPGEWYRQAIEIARKFIAPLSGMGSVYSEVKFVSDWVNLVCASGERIDDGIVSYEKRRERQSKIDALLSKQQEEKQRIFELRLQAEEEKKRIVYEVSLYDCGSIGW